MSKDQTSAVVVVTPELSRKVLNLVSMGGAPEDVLDGATKQIGIIIGRPETAIISVQASMKTYQEANGEVCSADMMLGGILAINLLIGSSEPLVRDLLNQTAEISRKKRRGAPAPDINNGEVF